MKDASFSFVGSGCLDSMMNWNQFTAPQPQKKRPERSGIWGEHSLAAGPQVTNDLVGHTLTTYVKYSRILAVQLVVIRSLSLGFSLGCHDMISTSVTCRFLNLSLERTKLPGHTRLPLVIFPSIIKILQQNYTNLRCRDMEIAHVELIQYHTYFYLWLREIFSPSRSFMYKEG